jgi:hypothetical protein
VVDHDDVIRLIDGSSYLEPAAGVIFGVPRRRWTNPRRAAFVLPAVAAVSTFAWWMAVRT